VNHLTLNKLLKGIEYSGEISDMEVAAITCDSRQVEAGSLFVCTVGTRFDGHDHAVSALEKGACAIIASRDLGLKNQILVKDSRLAYGIICGNWFDNPARKLKLMGVTGTNGKTTVTYLMKQILEQAGKQVGLIGTIHNEIDDMILPARHTTPDPMQLHAMFKRMVEAGCEYVVMEVSSHALDQHRVAGCRFAAAAFTNLTQEHLDYHGTMEAYFEAKKKLFSMCDIAVLNIDDEYGRKIADESDQSGVKKLTFACKTHAADYTAHDVQSSVRGCKFMFVGGDKLTRIDFAMPGMFSAANALAAAVSCIAVGIDFDMVSKGLKACVGVPGRVEILPTNTPYTVIRDYAHSPDGLKNVLETVKDFAAGRIVTLFGCAGSRDASKRPAMA